jgi:hypothetical protein
MSSESESVSGECLSRFGASRADFRQQRLGTSFERCIHTAKRSVLIRMESITHRKVPRPEASVLPETQQSKKQDLAPIRGQFLYGDLLLAALLPPGLVMLAFGGRPMLIAVCFGSMFTYIFDIFGAMEVPLRLVFVVC